MVVTEPERTCVALLDRDRWAGVSVLRESAPAELEGCLALVERERARMAMQGPPSVLATLEDAPCAMALSAR